MIEKNTSKTEAEIIHEYLISEGFHELSEEEMQTEWFKREMESIENLSCRLESEEEFKSFYNRT